MLRRLRIRDRNLHACEITHKQIRSYLAAGSHLCRVHANVGEAKGATARSAGRINLNTRLDDLIRALGPLDDVLARRLVGGIGFINQQQALGPGDARHIWKGTKHASRRPARLH
jgi:hypothetical protein